MNFVTQRWNIYIMHVLPLQAYSLSHVTVLLHHYIDVLVLTEAHVMSCLLKGAYLWFWTVLQYAWVCVFMKANFKENQTCFQHCRGGFVLILVLILVSPVCTYNSQVSSRQFLAEGIWSKKSSDVTLCSWSLAQALCKSCHGSLSGLQLYVCWCTST